MKILHILKSEPDETTRTLMERMNENDESVTFTMYGDTVDYRKLVKLIFETDKNISWW